MTRPLPNATDFNKPLIGVSRYSGRPVATRSDGLPFWARRSPAASPALALSTASEDGAGVETGT